MDKLQLCLHWTYIQRANFNYNAEGKFFSSEDGIVYHEHAKEVYGILALLGLVLTGILLVKLVTKRWLLLKIKKL